MPEVLKQRAARSWVRIFRKVRNGDRMGASGRDVAGRVLVEEYVPEL
jgi:hypothetical protein